MIGVYVRVSSVGQNIAGQKAEIERWLRGNKVRKVQWFIDKASGTHLKRPEFEKLEKAIFNGEIKTVVIYKLDRLSRSLQDGINILARWCDKGLRVVSVTQQIDFNGAVGKMMAAVLLGLAEMEQEVRRERQAAGIQAAKAAGVYLGRKPGTVKSSPQRALELRDKGNTIDEIASALQVSRRTVHRYLTQKISESSN